jgi:hypothetical protein
MTQPIANEESYELTEIDQQLISSIDADKVVECCAHVRVAGQRAIEQVIESLGWRAPWLFFIVVAVNTAWSLEGAASSGTYDIVGYTHPFTCVDQTWLQHNV